MTKSFAIGFISMCVAVSVPACGADTTAEVEGPVGEAEQELGALGQACYVGGTCNAGLSCCGAVCRDYQTDENHCGSCNHGCGAGNTCAKGACGPTCLGDGSDSCASGQICVDDGSGTNVWSMHGSCQLVPCSSTSFCQTKAGFSLDVECVSGGLFSLCYETATDPRHCGDEHADLCSTPGYTDYDGCQWRPNAQGIYKGTHISSDGSPSPSPLIGEQWPVRYEDCP